jgi:hypothetical protein
MSTRLLLGCFEVPGWGGAATFSYTLFDRMQQEGRSVAYANLVADDDARMLRDLFGGEVGNPRSLANVHTCVLERPLFRTHAGLAEMIRTVQPQLLFACGFIAAWLMKRAAPELPLVFFTSGSAHVKRLLHEGAIDDFMGFQRNLERGIAYTAPAGDRERVAVERSELIIIHSPHVRAAFEHFYAPEMGRVYENLISIADCVYWEAETFTHLALPFEQRDIDATVIASNWRRPEKNYPLLRRIAGECADLSLHVVGAPAHDPLPVRWHGLLPDRAAIYALLGRSKAIVCPSGWDPAPGVLFEASAMGCNVVASPNCGNWQLCHEDLLADAPHAFAAAIRRAIKAPYADNRERFRGGYADLVDTLDALL